MTGIHDEEADDPQHPEEHIAPVPRISVQAFCETEQTLALSQNLLGRHHCNHVSRPAR